MRTLSELQQAMAGALLSGQADAALLDGIAAGPIAAAAALRVHRNTVLAALSQALRLAYPGVAGVLGERAFDALSLAYIDQRPPRSGCLADFGEDFAGFVATHAVTPAQPWLSELARYDRAVECASQTVDDTAADLCLALDAQTQLRLAASLRVLGFRYAVAAIRDALEGQGSAAADLPPGEYWYAIWSSGQGACVRPLSTVAARFVIALLAGADLGSVLAGLEAQGDPAQIAASIEAEVFRAGYARLDLSPAVDTDA